MCIYLLYFSLFTMSIPLSGQHTLYTYDSFNISMIKLCIHWKEAKSLCTQFQFLPLEVYMKYWLLRQPPYIIVDSMFFSSLNIPALIKSMFSMDFTSPFCTTKERPLANDDHKSVYWNRIGCSPDHLLNPLYDLNLKVRELWSGFCRGLHQKFLMAMWSEEI